MLSGALSTPREVEYASIVRGSFGEHDGTTTVAAGSQQGGARADKIVVSKPPGAIFRLAPEKPSNWKTDRDFHKDFAVPSSSSDRTLLLTLQARAREGLVIALSSDCKYRGTEICLGVAGDSFCGTKLQHKKQKTVRVPGRVCREDTWVSYWVVCSCSSSEDTTNSKEESKLYVGVGDVPGEQCIAFMDMDIGSPHRAKNIKTESDDDKVKVEANEEEHIEQQTEEVKRNDKSLPKPFRYVGFRNAAARNDRQPPKPVFVRDLQLSSVPDGVKQNLARLPVDVLDLPMIVLGEDELSSLSTTDKETVKLLCKYREQCQKARARAAKFGVPYQPPDLASTLSWSEARRLRSNPASTTGFATGVDLQSEAERAKQERRRQRFGVPMTHGGDGDDKDGDEKVEIKEEEVEMGTRGEDALPVEQAWEKEELVGNQRVDPPESLWKDPPDSVEAKDEFRMEVEQPVLVPEKVHVFSIDWAAFKQIRTNDIMKHFAMYGPSYVEWLGDLSCNVLFEDKCSAARALEIMSIPLPSPPVAADADEGREESESNDTTQRPDLGRMGWRLGKQLLRKVANDNYGRKGTEARVLLRPATSLDVLHERPTGAARPPGFTTKRVLGPHSDLQDKKKSKKTKGGRETDNKAATDRIGGESKNQKKKKEPVTTEEMLYGGLSSGRPGFSVEEMEAERAKKKMKPSL